MASETVGQASADDGADGGHCHQQTQDEGIELEVLLERALGARDHRRVEVEHQAGQAGDEGG